MSFQRWKRVFEQLRAKISSAIAVRTLLDRRAVAMLFLGFSAGLPLLLIFSSLSLWLSEAGVDRGTVTMFSWAALGYSFKYVWAPLVDCVPVPGLTRSIGQRRAWLLCSQAMVALAIIVMGLIDPAASEFNVSFMAVAAVCLGFSSATQDVVLDAFRIESAPTDMQAVLSATYVAGYRVGMIASGAGALFLAQNFGSNAEHYHFSAWSVTYMIMACGMLVGMITTVLCPEPKHSGGEKIVLHRAEDHVRFFLLFLLSVLIFSTCFVFLGLKKPLFIDENSGPLATFLFAMLRLMGAMFITAVVVTGAARLGVVSRQMVSQVYVKPLENFFQRYGRSLSVWLLLLIGFYRLSDIVLGAIANVFYYDMGFEKGQIAAIVKTYGLIMTLLGGVLGGVLTVRFGVMRMMLWGAILSACTNVLFMVLAHTGNDVLMLYVVISADNLASGLAVAAFVAFLSSLTNVSFTAVQYAIFSSLMTLFPKLMSGYSGGLVDVFGYSKFFAFSALVGVPVIAILWKCWRLLEQQAAPEKIEM